MSSYGNTFVNGQMSYNAITPEHLSQIVRASVSRDGEWCEVRLWVRFDDGKLYVDGFPATQFIDCRFPESAL